MEFGKTFLDNFVLDIIGEGDPDYSNFKGEEGEEGPSLIETFIPFIFGIATYFLIIDLPCRIYKMVSKYFITYFNQSWPNSTRFVQKNAKKFTKNSSEMVVVHNS